MSRKPLSHIRVLDLSRVIAGPLAAQMLGDLGAEVIKVERAGAGDDARRMGPPFLKDTEGRDTRETPIILGSNRNKKSITLDLAKPEGQAIVRRLAAMSDVLDRELQGRRPEALRPGPGEPARAQSAPGLLLGHRLRPDRPVRAASRLRLDLPGDGRPHERHRLSGRGGRRAGQDRPVDRRFHRRAVRRHRRHQRAVRPRREPRSERRPRAAHRRRAARLGDLLAVALHRAVSGDGRGAGAARHARQRRVAVADVPVRRTAR